jgi:hypothetical protein
MLAGFGMAKHATTHKGDGWKVKFVINGLAGSVSLVIVLIFSVVKFTQGAWIVLVVAPIMVVAFLRLNRQYTAEQKALTVKSEQQRATSITRHDVTVLVDSVDLATISVVRYARTLNARKISAVHFVIDDRRAADIQAAWAASDAVDDVELELIDCPDRRLPNAALDYAIRMTEQKDVELTLLLPRRSYSGFLGRLLHDQTAEDIAAPISQLSRVVATIMPFDVSKMISGKSLVIESQKHDPLIAPKPVAAKNEIKPLAAQSAEPISHYAENMTPIGNITWRKRAHIQGRVTAIRTAPSGAAPVINVEIWDETGGVTLQFLGRREIRGLDIGSELRAEGMVAENDGKMTILNPSYELLK